MKWKILIAFLFIMLISCNQIYDATDTIIHTHDYNQDIYSTNRIVIRAAKYLSDEQVLQMIKDDSDESTFEDDYLETKNVHQVKSFDSLLRSGVMTSYFCGQNHYSISFYRDKNEVDIYYADTLKNKDSIRIYESGYQYSFIITKESWKSFLKQLEHKK